LLAKAVKGLLEILSPVAGSLPAGVEFRQAATIILLIAVCFVVGLVVRTRPGLRAKNAFEQAVLEKLPGYTFFRGLAQRLTGRSEEHSLAACRTGVFSQALKSTVSSSHFGGLIR
jgi:hypothetical protein